jgi:uncharacterized protein (TIGR00369 family)
MNLGWRAVKQGLSAVSGFEPVIPEFADRVRESFARQRFMTTIGASLTRVEPGAVDIELPFDTSLTQQHGFLHTGVVAAVADSACGYAALTLMDEESAVLSVEVKLNLLAPAAGNRFAARGRVVRSGRTLTVCRADVFATDADGERHVATMLATMMAVRGRAGLES